MSEARAATRCDRTDALRFFAIGLVVLTHLLNLRWEFKTLAPWLVEVMLAFNMPLFAFLGGYVLFGREGSHPARFLRGKALALLVPYLAWVAVEMPLRGLEPSEWLPRLARALVDPRAGFQMWFLWVLFAIFVVFVAVRSASRAQWVLIGSALVSAVLWALPLPVISGSEKVLWLYPFFVLGFLASWWRADERLVPLSVAIVGAAAFVAAFLFGGDGPANAYFMGAAGTAAAWGAYRMLPEPAIRPQAAVGSRTLGIYGGQMVLLPFLIFGAGWVGVTVSWVAVMAATIALTFALERTSVTRAVFLGKWPRHRR